MVLPLAHPAREKGSRRSLQEHARSVQIGARSQQDRHSRQQEYSRRPALRGKVNSGRLHEKRKGGGSEEGAAKGNKYSLKNSCHI